MLSDWQRFSNNNSNIDVIQLMYGLEALSLVKSDLLSLDFVVNRFFMKLFKTLLKLVNSRPKFNFEMPTTVEKRCASFDFKFSSSENIFCETTSYSF